VSPRPEFLRWLERLSLAGVLLLAVGCKAKIGDDCGVSTDCSFSGDRLCDTTQPGGYCTIFNCVPGSCPDEAKCIGFDPQISNAPECRDDQKGDRRRRSFCLRECDDDDDCRGGYVCADLGAEGNAWGAVLIEGSGSGKVCVVPYSDANPGPATNVGVCTGTDAGFDGWGAGGSAGSSGSGGTSGAAGGSGAGGMSGSAGMSGSGGTGGGAGTSGATDGGTDASVDGAGGASGAPQDAAGGG
jgi:hypothetical protein